MHGILFGLKRAWHGGLRVTRDAVAAFGLTAARFDLLYAVHLSHPFPITQRTLRRSLGVNRTTISRMLGSLEALGLVTRERRPPSDRRTNAVRLTVEGRSRIRAAIRSCIGSGAAQLAVDCGVTGGTWENYGQCNAAHDALMGLLQRIRVTFGDVAMLHYPWRPH